MGEILNRISTFCAEKASVIGVVLVSLLLIGSGIFLFLNREKPQEITLHQSQNQLGTEATRTVLKVDISGAVKTPGVYEFKEGERVCDALSKAGGLSDTVDTDFVTKNVNLAAFLSDGQKIYIPQRGEEATSNTQGVTTTTTLSGIININTASADVLDTLPGIGTARSQAIIKGRPYKSLDELVFRKIIPQSVYSNIKDKITL